MTALASSVVSLQDPQDILRRAQASLASGQPQEAEKLVRSLLPGGKGPLALWKFLANTLRHQKRFAEARDIQSMMVDTLPGDFSNRFDLAETLLMLGEFERGWREYRYRYSLPHTVRIERKVQMPRWDGQRLDGKTLLIHDEQGFGDTFQFLRLLPEAKRRSGAKIVLEISPATISFARRMQGIDAIIPNGTLPPAFHYHCELMSLPMAMALKSADLPGPMPYLTADPERLEKWRTRLKDLPRPLVGLNWGGRATPNPLRSMPLATLAPLAMEGVTFLSIQKGPQAVQAKNPPTGMRLENLGDEITDFDDTAAILSIADLLISIDSAPVHLAGALLRPAWVMLLHLADWRWFPDGEECPWYPSLRLFRQKSQNDWNEVASRIAAELKIFCKAYAR